MSNTMVTTDLFSEATTERCAVVFLGQRETVLPASTARGLGGQVGAVLARLAAAGWSLSAQAMIHGQPGQGPSGYATAFAHDKDFYGVFEAPTLPDALLGTSLLVSAGWEQLAATDWLIGPRDLNAPRGVKRTADLPWGFLALWQWNDAWWTATSEERRSYDRECDTAFQADLDMGIQIAGRHRLDWASAWDHVGIWQAATPAIVATAMREHEAVGDFKFTSSRHYLGRRSPLLPLLEGMHA